MSSWRPRHSRWRTNRLTAHKRLKNDHLCAAVRANKCRAYRLIHYFVTVGLGDCDSRRHVQEFAHKRKLLFASVIGNQTEVTDAVETAWQHMQQEAAHELFSKHLGNTR